MGVESIYSRVQYTPLSTDPNLRARINKALDIAQDLPLKISDTYPERSEDIYKKIFAIVHTNQPNPELEYKSILKEKTYLQDMLVVLCSWGTNTTRTSVIKHAFERLSRMNPLPRIIFVEGSTDGRESFEFVKDYDNVNYVRLDLRQDAFRNLFMKEILWNYGVQQMLKAYPDIKKICYLDADVAFADQYSFQLIYNALDNYDVVSPMRGSYYAGNKPYAKKYKMMLSCGFCLNRRMTNKGWPGFGIALTTDFLFKRFKGELPCTCCGLGDVLFWYIVSNGQVNKYNWFLPYGAHKLKPYLIPNVKIGYANNVVMHFDHGPMSDRTYRVYSRLLTRSVKDPFKEFARIGVSTLLGWADTEEVRRYRYCLENLLIFNRKDIKLTEPEDADQLFNWLMGITCKPPMKLRHSVFAVNGNVMPCAGVSIPRPNKISEV